MRTLGATVARLKSRPVSESGRESAAGLVASRFEGANPGGLRAWKHVPADGLTRPGLVVVLHGCSQTAAAYDVGSGWSTLADRHGFIVLYPEQPRANNPGLCFNWYAPADAKRGAGEAASIRSAIEAVVLDHAVDRSRVFVTGLSAGGAMTAAMLATYPEVFAGGAIIAGLPFDCAGSIPEAFDRMRGHGLQGASVSTAAVLTASGHGGPWPSVSIWHGTADLTVSSANADALVDQWAGVHDVGPTPDETTDGAGHTRRVWRNAAGVPVLEDYRIAGMGHGVPIDTRGVGACGAVGPYMLEAGLSSTDVLAERWGLAENAHDALTAPEPGAPETVRTPVAAWDPDVRTLRRQAPASRVRTVIEDALRRAGLMP